MFLCPYIYINNGGTLIHLHHASLRTHPMIFEQHYLDCLSQASYFIGDETTGRAVVVDPRRDIAPYLESAQDHGMSIDYVLETHFHADFLSGHLEMAAATGAQIGYGAAADTEFDSLKLEHGDRISLGQVEIEVRHTPGHTPESVCYVIYETTDSPPHAVLTGDTMFIGDVGRPDLLSAAGMTAAELAGMLYDSLHRQLLTLPDETLVYPGHGAGSSCGKNLSSETSSTIGAQRATNYALAPMSKDEFVDVVTAGQTAPPNYFAHDAALNRELRPLLDEGTLPASLLFADAMDAQAAGAIILDARSPEDFASGHFIGSVNIGIGGRYAEFAGGVLSPKTGIILVADEGQELEAKNRLARIGYDNVIGAIASPLQAMTEHPEATTHAKRVDVVGLDELRKSLPHLQLVDVRQPGETAGGSIEGAICIPLTRLVDEVSVLDESKPVAIYCAGGYRSSIAASRLRADGFEDVVDLLGGYGAWTATHANA